MHRSLPTYKVFVGESLPDLGLFVRENTQLITGLGSGHTFALKVASLDGDVLFAKTTGIAGQAGEGFVPLGTPNVVIQWGAEGELDQLSAGTFWAQLAITRTSDSRVRYVQWLISARAAL